MKEERRRCWGFGCLRRSIADLLKDAEKPELSKDDWKEIKAELAETKEENLDADRKDRRDAVLKQAVQSLAARNIQLDPEELAERRKGCRGRRHGCLSKSIRSVLRDRGTPETELPSEESIADDLEEEQDDTIAEGSDESGDVEVAACKRRFRLSDSEVSDVRRLRRECRGRGHRCLFRSIKEVAGGVFDDGAKDKIQAKLEELKDSEEEESTDKAGRKAAKLASALGALNLGDKMEAVKEKMAGCRKGRHGCLLKAVGAGAEGLLEKLAEKKEECRESGSCNKKALMKELIPNFDSVEGKLAECKKERFARKVRMIQQKAKSMYRDQRFQDEGKLIKMLTAKRVYWRQMKEGGRKEREEVEKKIRQEGINIDEWRTVSGLAEEAEFDTETMAQVSSADRDRMSNQAEAALKRFQDDASTEGTTYVYSMFTGSDTDDADNGDSDDMPETEEQQKKMEKKKREEKEKMTRGQASTTSRGNTKGGEMTRGNSRGGKVTTTKTSRGGSEMTRGNSRGGKVTASKKAPARKTTSRRKKTRSRKRPSGAGRRSRGRKSSKRRSRSRKPASKSSSQKTGFEAKTQAKSSSRGSRGGTSRKELPGQAAAQAEASSGKTRGAVRGGRTSRA